MHQFAQSTRSTISTIKAHALLSKALTNDPKPTPGYLFPDIARLTHSTATCSIVLTQLLKAITPSGRAAGSSSVSSTHAQSFVGSAPGGPGSSGASSAYTSSPHVLLKALKILRQLAQSGSVEFRTLLARRGKALLVEMVGYKGPWDEVHGDRYNEDVRTVAEDLIEYMHANPVLEQDERAGMKDLTDKEAAVLQSSTQDLQGFGHPDYEDSDSEDDTSRNKARVKSKKPRKGKVERGTPPLPGFGNPAFEKDNAQAGKSFDKKPSWGVEK
ncbi:AP-4 complex accessory subunit Tepsin [Mortierella alpina]|nr:AP-4 complex accessory subunit Tepsin [Mortierella alpina]